MFRPFPSRAGGLQPRWGVWSRGGTGGTESLRPGKTRCAVLVLPGCRGRAWLTTKLPATRSLPAAFYLPVARWSCRRGDRREPDWLGTASPPLPGWRSSSRSPGKAFPRPGTWPPRISNSLWLASFFPFPSPSVYYFFFCAPSFFFFFPLFFYIIFK